MLNQSELNAYFIREGLSPSAIAVVYTVRNSQPTRRVQSGKMNVACRYASKKMGMVIQAESHRNELPALISWDFDNQTHEIYDQPVKVKLQYRNKNGRLVSHMATADFFLLQEGFTGWVECKTEEWLQARESEGSQLYVRDGNGKWRCPPAEEYAASLGLSFRVRSSAENNWTRVRNIEFLADYLDVQCPKPDESAIKEVYAQMAGQAWQPLKSLVDAGSTADTIYKMIVDGNLFFDFDRYLLAEPERALIFRDQQSAVAHSIYLESNQLPAVSSLKPVTIAVGQSFLWDGQPWKIINVGVNDVFMEDGNKIISSLAKDQFPLLTMKGIITGLPEHSAPEHLLAESIIRSASPDDYAHALYRYNAIFPDSPDSPIKASERAIRKWRALYRKSELTYGSGFLGLLPKINKRGNRDRKVDAEVIRIMNDVINELYATSTKKSLATCWGDVRNKCEAAGLVPPCEQTFKNEIKRRSENKLKEAREGEKAAYTDSPFIWYLESTSPRHGDRPFEIGHIDHTELDLQFVGSRRGEKLQKAWLTVLLDANTRMVLAWILMFDAPSYRSCMAVIRECVKNHGRVPRYIVVDKGSDFESTYFECLLARLKCNKKIRPGSKPRFGSVIERFFGVNNQTFLHNLRGNNQALQRPRSLSKSHDPRELAVWTLPEFHKAFDGFLKNVYSKLEHSALGLSPADAMAIGLKQSGLREHVLIPYTNDFVIMCLPSTPKGTAKVDPSRGIKIGYIYYWSIEFKNPAYAHSQVAVRYDPFDMSVAMAWLGDHWADCRSELAAEFNGRSEKDVKSATLELRSRMKSTGLRRALNAQMIAAYFREISGTEQELLNRQKQSDTHLAYNLRAKPNQTATVHQLHEHMNVWEKLTIKTIGEFQ